MKFITRLSASLMCSIIALSLSSAANFLHSTSASMTPFSSSPVDTDAEYSNGTIQASFCSIRYNWVNTSKTQIIHYILYSNTVNSPIVNFVGQHFWVGNGTEIFVGSTMALLEVYNDTSGDGIPQANFTSGVSEIKYYLLMNSSVGYTIGDIHKVSENGVPHYRWSFRYITIDGVLLYPEEQPGHVAAKVTVDQLGLQYDFYVDQNVSNLKIGFDIGSITSIQQWPEEPSVVLDGLSLSLLFSTATIAAKPFTTFINGQPYNSTNAADSALAADSGQVAVGLIRAYDLVFGGTYNLTRGQNVETYNAKSEVAATSSVPQCALSDLEWTMQAFEESMNLTALFGAPWETVDLNCNSSALLYRICYPIWDGLRIEHDPTYVAYLFSSIEIPEFPALMVLPIFVSIGSLAFAWKKLRKHRHILRQAQ